MLKNLGALRRAEAERCSPHCVGEQGTDKSDDLPEDPATTVAVWKRLAGLRLAELVGWRARADQLERKQLKCDQLLAQLGRAQFGKVETRSAGVGPDEPHHHDERVSGAMSPLLNYVYHKGAAKGYLLGATAGSKGAHTGPVVTDGDAFWEAYIGLGGDGRRKGSEGYTRRTARRSIENLFAQGTGKGKRGGQTDRRQGKGIVVNYGGQWRGKGGHEKGGQGQGQIAASQWTTSAVGDDVGLA